jgi:hypothetical protein
MVSMLEAQLCMDCPMYLHMYRWALQAQGELLWQNISAYLGSMGQFMMEGYWTKIPAKEMSLDFMII